MKKQPRIGMTVELPEGTRGVIDQINPGSVRVAVHIPSSELIESDDVGYIWVEINNAKVQVSPVCHVAFILEISGEPAEYDVIQDINGQLTTLDPKGEVVVVGGERFFTRPRVGLNA